jgi:hypothetical protein
MEASPLDRFIEMDCVDMQGLYFPASGKRGNSRGVPRIFFAGTGNLARNRAANRMKFLSLNFYRARRRHRPKAAGMAQLLRKRVLLYP